MKDVCEFWSDEQLDEFLETHKKVVGGLTTYPPTEWAEKVKRKLITLTKLERLAK